MSDPEIQTQLQCEQSRIVVLYDSERYGIFLMNGCHTRTHTQW